MKKIDISQAITILANLGVIAGIVFLAIELRQNNELMVAQARFNRLSFSTESTTIIAESPDLAGFLLRANNGEELDPDEALRLEYYFRRVFENMQWTFQNIPEVERPLERWRQLCSEPYRNAVWHRIKAQFDADFIAYMDERFCN